MKMIFNIVLHYGYIYGGFIRDIIAGIEPTDLDIHIGLRDNDSNRKYAQEFCTNLKILLNNNCDVEPIMEVETITFHRSRYYPPETKQYDVISNYRIIIDLGIVTKIMPSRPFVIDISFLNIKNRYDYDVNTLKYSHYHYRNTPPRKCEKENLYFDHIHQDLRHSEPLCDYLNEYTNKHQMGRRKLLDFIQSKDWYIIPQEKVKSDATDGEWKYLRNGYCCKGHSYSVEGYWAICPRWITLARSTISCYYFQLITMKSILDNIKNKKCLQMGTMVMPHRIEKMKSKGWNIYL